MKILIIYAYPNHQGLNVQVLKNIQQNLSDKHTIKLIDLYADGFDPVLRFDDDHRRRDLDKDPDTETYRQLITWADHLIFVFPIWWGGMPAILKGFIDRVFAKGFAYSYKGLQPIAHLKGKSAWIVTTHDTPSIISKLFVQDYGRVLKRQILGMCGIKPVKHTEIAYIRGSSEEKIKQQLEKIGVLASQI